MDTPKYVLITEACRAGQKKKIGGGFSLAESSFSDKLFHVVAKLFLRSVSQRKKFKYYIANAI